MTLAARSSRLTLLAVVLAFAGCLGLGPRSISRDRVDYHAALGDTQKVQALLNIVRLRYVDVPVFLDVAQIVSGYTLESTVSGVGTIFGFGGAVPGVPDNSVALGAQGKLTDRPTITYVPLSGAQLAKNILMPLPPALILFLIQAGWPADIVFSIAVDAINGLQNHVGAPSRFHPGDPEFVRLLQLVRQVQRSSSVGMQVERAKDGSEHVTLAFRRRSVAPAGAKDVADLKAILGLHPEKWEFRVRFGTYPAENDEIALLTRSMAKIMVQLALDVDVPAAHLAERRAAPIPAEDHVRREPLMRIGSSVDRPADAFVAVRYREHWFWVDDRDLASKQTFAFLLFLFSLADTGGKETLPLITIPAG